MLESHSLSQSVVIVCFSLRVCELHICSAAVVVCSCGRVFVLGRVFSISIENLFIVQEELSRRQNGGEKKDSTCGYEYE